MSATTRPAAELLPALDHAAPLTRPHLLACRDCGQLQAVPALAPGLVARCSRCNAVMRRSKRDPLRRGVALCVTALVLLSIACGMTLMSVSTAGIFHSANLFTGPERLDARGVWELSVIVLFTTVGAPLIYLACLLYVLIGLRLRRTPGHLRVVFGLLERLRPWAMIEVFLLGVFVAFVKLGSLVHIEIGAAFWALCALMLVMIATDAALDPYAVWDEMERRMVPDIPAEAAAGGAHEATTHRLLGCHVCGKVSRAPLEARAFCPRCGSALHRRKPNAIARCTALVIASTILYIPANIYPVLTVIQLGSGAPSTILGGAEELLTGGMWPLALLVFGASIMVPMLKLLGLSFLLITTHRGWDRHLRDRTVLYRIVNSIGRWSMIDIFMESILVALVQFGAIVSINPGVGAVAFAGVVVLTMFAAESFDSRLIWDAAGQNPDF